MTEEKKKKKVNFKGVSILLFVVALVCTVDCIIPNSQEGKFYNSIPQCSISECYGVGLCCGTKDGRKGKEYLPGTS